MTPHGYKVVKNPIYFHVPDWLVRHSRLIRFIYVRLKSHIAQKNKIGLRANWLAKEWTQEIQDNVNFSMDIHSKSINLLKSHNGVIRLTKLQRAGLDVRLNGYVSLESLIQHAEHV